MQTTVRKRVTSIRGPRVATPGQRTAHTQRDLIEILLRRAEFLPPEDETLLKGIFERGLSPLEVGRLVGRDPTAIRGHAGRLLKRLDSAAFLYVLRNWECWPDDLRRTAELVFLHRVPQHRAAKQLGFSLHHLRRQVNAIRILMEQTDTQASGRC